VRFFEKSCLLLGLFVVECPCKQPPAPQNYIMQRPIITTASDGRTYTWDADDNAYLGVETSCGCYGAALLEDGRWSPAHNDGFFQIWDDESYDTPEEACERSHGIYT
jgi:hypothetical protein